VPAKYLFERLFDMGTLLMRDPEPANDNVFALVPAPFEQDGALVPFDICRIAVCTAVLNHFLQSIDKLLELPLIMRHDVLPLNSISPRSRQFQATAK
jgi:hypothetical protein